MAKFFSQTVASGQAVSSEQIALKSVVLASGSAASTVTIKGNGTTLLVVAAPANASQQAVIPGHATYAMHIDGPVTLDLAGTGASVRLDY